MSFLWLPPRAPWPANCQWHTCLTQELTGPDAVSQAPLLPMMTPCPPRIAEEPWSRAWCVAALQHTKVDFDHGFNASQLGAFKALLKE